MANNQLYEFIPDRLYYATLSKSPADDAETHYFSTDGTLVYLPFEADFGPLNLGQIYAFFAQLSNKLKDKLLKQKRIIYYSLPNYNYRANSLTLLSLFMVCVLNRDPHQIQNQILSQVQPPLTPFRDACMGPCNYGVTVLDCMFGIQKAMQQQLFNLNTFKYDDYYFYSQVENGDLTWILPEKIIAFAGPVSQSHPFFKYHPFTPQSYIPLYQARNVTAVVRLNEACYNKVDFVKARINHYDLPYPDGSIPTDRIVKQFFQIIDQEQGAVAVHCKAGLGRTGTLIGLYMMKKYNFTAREVIAWLRILRPGMVLGQQQQYLLQMEGVMQVQIKSPIKQQQEVEVFQKQPTYQSPSKTGYYQQQTYSQQNAVTNKYSNVKAQTSPIRPPSSKQQSGKYGNQSPSQYKIGFNQGNTQRVSSQQGFYSPYIKQNQASTRPTGTQSSIGEKQQPNYLNSKTSTFNNSPSRQQQSPYQQYQKQSYLQQNSPVSRQNNVASAISSQQQEKTINYGFGTNGRVHPDVVKSPVSHLNSQMKNGALPGIKTLMRGRGGAVSDLQ